MVRHARLNSAKFGHSMVELSDELRSPVTRRLFDYWRAKRGGHARPGLEDFDLMDLYDIAPFMTIRDAVEGGREFRCRYFGTRMVELFGLEATGKLMSECYTSESAEVLSKRMRMTLDQPEPVRVVGIVTLTEHQPPRSYEAVWLGLDGKDNAQHAVGVLGIDYELTQDERERHGGPDDWSRIAYLDDAMT